MNTSLFEINWRLAAISKRKDTAFRLECAIHGIELKSRESEFTIKSTPQDEATVTSAFEQAKIRKAKEHGK